MRKLTTLFLGLSVFFVSCEEEEITIVETTTTDITGTLVEEVIVEGDHSFSAVVEGVDFLYDILEVTNHLGMDTQLDIDAKDAEGENAFHIMLPLFTVSEGDHVLTYTPTAGYLLTYLQDGDIIYRPTNHSTNVLTILELNVDTRFIKGTFSTIMEGEGPDLENVTGEFEVYY